VFISKSTGNTHEVERQEILKRFTEVLAVEGLAVKESGGSFQIVSQ
jgi:hypothetical protein